MAQVLTMTVPLTEDETDGLMIADTYIPLERVVYAYQQGNSPEQIARSFSALKLADVYAVIGYYLDHQIEVDAYLKRREAAAEAIRRDIETHFPSHDLRAKLLTSPNGVMPSC